MAQLGYWKNHPFFCAEEVKGSGKGLSIRTSDLVKDVCDAFGPCDTNGLPEVAFWKDLDAFDVSEKLECLARLIKNSSCEAQLEETGAACPRQPQALSKLQWELHHLKLQISEVARDFEDNCKEQPECNQKESVSGSDVDLDSELEEGSETNSELKVGHQDDKKYTYHFWEAGCMNLYPVCAFVRGMPQARRIITRVLRNRNQSAQRAFDAVQYLKRLQLRRDQVQSELDTLKRRRKGIEAALEKAGIPACLSSQHGKWPDSDVVDKYILDESMTVDEVIQSQQEHMLGGAARRPGPRTRGEAKSTAKREGQR